MNSIPYYDKNGIRITKGLFELPDGKQYSIKNIDSVALEEEAPQRKNPIICIAIGTFVMFAKGWAILVGLLIIGLGIWMWQRQKKNYWIIIKTSGADGKAYSSTSFDLIKEVRSALNAAIEAY